MMSIINEEDWKSVAEMIGVEIDVPFKVEIPTHFKQYMKRAMEDYDANIEDIEYCVYADGFACYDSCRSIFFKIIHLIYYFIYKVRSIRLFIYNYIIIRKWSKL